MKEPRQDAYESLVLLSERRGYLTYDDIADCADNFSLPLPDVDWLSGSLATLGVLIYDKPPTASELETEEYDDFSQSDYEIIYTKISRMCPSLIPLVDEVRNIQPPQRGEIKKIKYLVAEGNQYARNRMIEMYLRHALRTALQRVETYGVDIVDAVGDACIGLVMAVDRYDPDTPGAFASYAAMWMHQNISRNQPSQRPLVYYPVHRREPYFAMYPTLKKYGCVDCPELQRCAKAREMVRAGTEAEEEAIKFTIAQMLPDFLVDFELIEWFLTGPSPNSCDELLSFGTVPITLENLWIPDEALDLVEQELLSDAVENVLSTLREREQRVLRERYGFNGDEKTLEQVGEMLNVTRERVRQIELKALQRLRHPARSKYIVEFYK